MEHMGLEFIDATGFLTSEDIAWKVYPDVSSLPSPTTYHGMFAHVHATGAGYFAHAGAWTKLANNATTLAGYGITDAATSAQGTKADSALQDLTATSITTLSDVSSRRGRKTKSPPMSSRTSTLLISVSGIAPCISGGSIISQSCVLLLVTTSCHLC